MQLTLGKCGNPLVYTAQGWETVPPGTKLRKVEWPEAYYVVVDAENIVALHGCGQLSCGAPKFQARLVARVATEVNPRSSPRIRHCDAPLAVAVGRIPRRALLACIGSASVSVCMPARS